MLIYKINPSSTAFYKYFRTDLSPASELLRTDKLARTDNYSQKEEGNNIGNHHSSVHSNAIQCG